jgi:hypothetical protein
MNSYNIYTVDNKYFNVEKTNIYSSKTFIAMCKNYDNTLVCMIMEDYGAVTAEIIFKKISA